ncbi:protein kinase domain-containing protein [Endozoicomonadaceae bacterium StTr2]
MKRIIVGLALLLMAGSQAFAGGFSWQNADTSYLIDPDGRFMERFIEACEKGQDEKSRRFYKDTCSVKVLAESDDGTLYHLTRIDDGTRADMDGNESWQLFVMKGLPATFEKETLSPLGDSEPIVSEWFYLTHAVKLKTLGDSAHVVSSEGVIKLMRLKGKGDNDRLKPDDPNQVFESLASVAREARILQYLDHPHICRLVSGTESFAIQNSFRQSFADYLRTSPRLSDAIEHLRSVAGAVAYCHENGVVHGDLSSEHVFIMLNGAAALADFGRANILGTARSELRALGAKRFTYANNPHHAPEVRFPLGPEIAMEWKYVHVTPAADVWSFGYLLASVLSLYPEYQQVLSQTRLGKPIVHHIAEREGLSVDGYLNNRSDSRSALSEFAVEKIPLEIKVSACDKTADVDDPLIDLILRCTEPKADKRPDMAEVVQILGSIQF